MKEQNVFQRLLEVQKEAKAPRSIDGKFGKSRSAEQILEAYKPVCNAHGLFLYTSDEIKEVGGRNYITSTATVVDVETSEKHSATAEAWEGEIPQSKYGADIIDSSQLTGKTSSYAKKYALQNLFAIDDTKDADIDDIERVAKATPVVRDRVAEASSGSEPMGESLEETLTRAKKTINETLIKQNYLTVDAKRAFITGVLKHDTIDNLNEADSVMDALENEL